MAEHVGIKVKRLAHLVAIAVGTVDVNLDERSNVGDVMCSHDHLPQVDERKESSTCTAPMLGRRAPLAFRNGNRAGQSSLLRTPGLQRSGRQLTCEDFVMTPIDGDQIAAVALRC